MIRDEEVSPGMLHECDLSSFSATTVLQRAWCFSTDMTVFLHKAPMNACHKSSFILYWKDQVGLPWPSHVYCCHNERTSPSRFLQLVAVHKELPMLRKVCKSWQNNVRKTTVTMLQTRFRHTKKKKNQHGMSDKIGWLSVQHACGSLSTRCGTAWTQLGCYKGTSRDCSVVTARWKCMDIAIVCWSLGLRTHHYNFFYLVIDLYFRTGYVVLPLTLLLGKCFRTVLIRQFELFFLFLSPICSVASLFSCPCTTFVL